MNILLYATAWGPRHGGLNAFNRSIALALSARTAGAGQVYCAVLAPAPADVADAAAGGVSLLSIGRKDHVSELDSSWAMDVIEDLAERGVAKLELCIGHDVISGAIATRTARALKARSAVIHHMDYRSYHGAKGEADRTDELERKQAALFEASDLLFAVGPALMISGSRLGKRKDLIELIPGLEVAPEQHSSDTQVEAITFGRFDASNRVIKQARLAAKAFGAATAAAHAAGRSTAFHEAPLSVVGVDPGDAKEKRELQKLADQAAGGVVNILPLAFDPDPGQVMKRLAGSNLALVLSLHEGFSLTAWEAIAAATPLVLTRSSGVYRLIDERLGGAGLGCLKVVDIRGRREPPFVAERDVAEVSKAIAAIAHDLRAAKADAVTLREMLLNRVGCRWSDAADRVLETLTAPHAFDARVLNQALSSSSPVRPVTAKSVLENPLSACVQMTISPTQGSHAQAYDLTPEVRFGRHTLTVDGVDVDCGLCRAELNLALDGCEIPAGERLGDKADTAPFVISEPPSRWRIEGPLEKGLLARRALGEERLCVVRMHAEEATATFEITCRQRDLSLDIPKPRWGRRSPAQDKVMKIFLAKCLTGGAASELVLSRARLALKAKSK